MPYVLKEGSGIEFGDSSRTYYIRGLHTNREAGTKRPAGDMYQKVGFLESNDEIRTAPGKRLKPHEHWESTEFADDKQKSKFLRLLGAKKKKK